MANALSTSDQRVQDSEHAPQDSFSPPPRNVLPDPGVHPKGDTGQSSKARERLRRPQLPMGSLYQSLYLAVSDRKRRLTLADLVEE